MSTFKAHVKTVDMSEEMEADNLRLKGEVSSMSMDNVNLKSELSTALMALKALRKEHRDLSASVHDPVDYRKYLAPFNVASPAGKHNKLA